MRCMVIDIGSNTVKYDVFSLDGGALSPVARRSRTVRLIDRIKDGKLKKDGRKKLCETLEKYTKDAKELDCARVEAFATASLRRLNDPQKTIDKIEKETGLKVRLLSGEEEAACAFRGMLLTALPLPRHGVMLDMGGGSTEITVFKDGVKVFSHSMPFGALSLKTAFGAGPFLSKERFEEISAHAASFVPEEARTLFPGQLAAVPTGGTAKAILKLTNLLLPGRANGCEIPPDVFEELTGFFMKEDPAAAELVKAAVPERYDLMAAGLAGYAGVFASLGVKDVIVCKGGIREGYLPYIDGRDDLVYKETEAER